MASTVAMFTGLSGLTANSRNLDTIGNNIANVNTTAFKSSRLIFATQFSRNLSLGGGPSAATGGTNPRQVGLGVTIAGTQRDFTTGSLSATGGPSDLSITGDGFFMVNRGGQTLYTRAGSFTRNADGELVNVSGDRVLGWSSDNTFQVDRTQLTPLTIPLGRLRIAEASTTAIMNGTLNNTLNPDLNIGSFVATTGSRQTLAAMTDISGTIATTSLVTDLRNPSDDPIAAVGDVIALRRVLKGSNPVPDATLTVTATTTLQDVMDFLARGLGIQNTGETPTPGVTLQAGGVVRINGNSGENNNIDLQTTMLRVEPPAGAATSPLTVTPVLTANGESQYTQFSVFDSLGNRVNLNLTMTMVDRGTTAVPGSRWRYDINSPDNVGGDPRITTGTIDFDVNGNLLPGTSPSITLNRGPAGAEVPLTFTLDFSRAKAAANPTGANPLTMQSADGSSLGTLSSFSIGNDGIITGGFDNGLTRTLGQVPLAAFSNPEGLVEVGQSLFTNGANAGTPVTVIPGQSGTGGVLAGSLELSNVDLSAEFVNLILASTGYSGASRVITTTDQLLQQLLTIGR
ncbi:MAG: flagellar hook protein FlgE [bacterium]